MYIEWDYQYWYENVKFKHLAQTTFLIDFRLKYYDDNEWVAMIDLDEYIYNTVDKIPLLKYINNLNADIIIIANHWATIDGDYIKYNKVSKSGFLSRTKCIYNTKYRGYFGIHWIKPYLSVNDRMLKSVNLKMLHLIDVLHPERKKRMEYYIKIPLTNLIK